MAALKISKVKTAIKQASDGIIISGDYLILNAQVPKTGKINVRCAGTFGTATISVGYLDNGVFNVVDQPNGSAAAFTAFFALDFACGEQTNVSDGPAIQVSGVDGATDLSLTVSSID